MATTQARMPTTIQMTPAAKELTLQIAAAAALCGRPETRSKWLRATARAPRQKYLRVA